MSHAIAESLTRDTVRPARYAWLITKDHLFEPGDVVDDETGVSGPSNAPDDLLADLAAGTGRRFRMYDDDGELYYTGLFAPADLAMDEAGFGPLWDFGTPNAGCTTIKYRDSHGAWVTL